MVVESNKSAVEDRLSHGLLGQWYLAACSVQVRHNSPYGVKIAGEQVVLWRGADGLVRCVEDFCPHRGAKLSLGVVMDKDLSCRYHGVTVDGTGAIVRVPAMPGCALEGRRPLRDYKVREVADAIFIYVPSVEVPEAPEPVFPYELTEPSWQRFVCSVRWDVNHRLIVENVADPMHGVYLHADSFTLAYGAKQDTLKLERTDTGFSVSRVAQQGVNFDRADFVFENGLAYFRLDIPYPSAAGPGGPFRIIAFTTPIDEQSSLAYFYRARQVDGISGEAWRFLYRTRLESRHWDVLEQDRVMLESVPLDARKREMLYQHDVGVSRIRQVMTRLAKSQLAAEAAADRAQVG